MCVVVNPQRREALGAQCPCHVRLPVVLLWACLGIVRGGAGQFEWQRATPESQGVSPAQLEAIRERMATKKTRALLVVRNDRIVCEWYAPGVNATTRQGTASLAKALVGGLSLAVAMQDGKISPADPAARFIPQWRSDPRKAKITIRHLGSHTSGLEDAEAGNQPHEQLTGWKGDFWKRLDPPRDPFTLARDETPMIFEAGTKFQYSNPGIETMTYCVTAAIRDGEHKDARTLLRERLLRPIGVPDAEWSAGYSKTFSVDDLPLVASWGGAAFTPRATARLGRLVLREGNWEGRQLFSREIVRLVTADAGLIGNCAGVTTNFRRTQSGARAPVINCCSSCQALISSWFATGKPWSRGRVNRPFGRMMCSHGITIIGPAFSSSRWWKRPPTRPASSSPASNGRPRKTSCAKPGAATTGR